MTDLHLIVLAAGQGTRMKSTMPKVLHPVAHKPMVHHVLAVAEACKAASVTGVVSPGMPAIEAAFGEHKLAVQQQALGTGDAVKAGLSAIPEDASGIAVVLYADTPLVRQETVEALVKPIIDGQAAVTFFAMRVDEPGAYGRMVTDADGALLRITEAREADEATLAINLCNGGFCAFDLGKARGLVHQIDNQNNKGEYYVTDLVEIARDAGHGVHAVEGDPTDAMGVNDRADLALVEAVMQKRLRTHHMLNGVTMIAPETVFLATDTALADDTVVEPHVVFGPAVTVTGPATIRAFSHLEGCEIAEGAVIGPYARIRPGTSVGEKARIGNFVEAKNVTMGEGAKANHLTYLGDATVGPEANIGAGTITCNYDGFIKSKTEIGRNAFIGSNSALVAPVKVGDGAIIGAGSTITDDVKADAIAVARSAQVEKPSRAPSFRESRAAAKADKDK